MPGPHLGEMPASASATLIALCPLLPIRMSAVSIDLTQRLNVEAMWFESHPVTIDRGSVDPSDQQGFDTIGDHTIAQLCGAPAGADVTMAFDGQSLIFEVSEPTFFEDAGSVSVHRDQHGNPYLSLDFLWLKKDAPAGFGAALLWRMVRACHALQIPVIRGEAVGGRMAGRLPNGERIMGYYAWPRYGFDGPVMVTPDDLTIANFFPNFPEGVARGTVATLSELLETEGGPAYWLIAGDARHVAFAIAPTSQSVITLHRYLTNKEFFA
ncbi:hypothetical protein BZY94_05145 [Burkholderia territorii]|nr:hypothetical protein BZY94_05145 [Burkholderia territorii]